MNSLIKRRSKTRSDLWTITFTDLLTLLIGFFVLRYTLFTNLEATKAKLSTAGPIVTENIKSEIFQRLNTFLSQTASYHEVTNLSEEDPTQTTRVFDGVATLSPTSSGAVIALNTDSIGRFGQGNSLAANSMLSSIAKVISDSTSLVVIRYEAPEVTLNHSSFGSGWTDAAAIVASLSRQLVDGGVDKKKIMVETVITKNARNKGNLALQLIETGGLASKKSTFANVLLNLNHSDTASEPGMIFLDL